MQRIKPQHSSVITEVIALKKKLLEKNICGLVDCAVLIIEYNIWVISHAIDFDSVGGDS